MTEAIIIPRTPDNIITKTKNTMSLSDLIKGYNKQEMKNVETVVKHIGGSATVVSLSEKKQEKKIVVLILTDKWVTVDEWLSDEVLKILFVPDVLFEKLGDRKRRYLAVEAFGDYYSGALECKAYEMNEEYGFTHVVCLGEEDIIRCARIREVLGLRNGQSTVSSLRYRDKIVMKDVLRENGVKTPTHYAPVENVYDIMFFTQNYGYPVVVKPRKGYGSVNTNILHNDEDMHKLFSSYSFCKDVPLDLEIETFVEGMMYHIDGFFHEGEFKLIWPSLYINLCIDFTSAQYNASYTLSPDNELVPRLQDYVKSVVLALDGPKSFPFHAEVWHTPEDEFVLCEIASRVGGAGIRFAIREQFDMHLDRIWVQAQTEDFIDDIIEQNYQERTPKHTSCGWIIIFPKEGTLTSIPKTCPLDFVTRYDAIGQANQTYTKTQHSADAIAQFITTSSTEETNHQNLLTCLTWITSTTTWNN